MDKMYFQTESDNSMVKW